MSPSLTTRIDIQKKTVTYYCSGNPNGQLVLDIIAEGLTGKRKHQLGHHTLVVDISDLMDMVKVPGLKKLTRGNKNGKR